MTPEQRRVVFGLVHLPGRPPTTTAEDVLRAFTTEDGVGLGAALLGDAIKTRAARDLEYALLVCKTFGFGPEHRSFLLKLASADWHHSHENVVWYLGNYEGDDVVDALDRATQWVPEYLDFDEHRAWARRAICELGKQPGARSRAVLSRIANSGEPVVAEEARTQLER